MLLKIVELLDGKIDSALAATVDVSVELAEVAQDLEMTGEDVARAAFALQGQYVTLREELPTIRSRVTQVSAEAREIAGQWPRHRE